MKKIAEAKQQQKKGISVFYMEPKRHLVVNSKPCLLQQGENMNAIFRRIDDSERQDENGCGERPGVAARTAAC